MFDTTKIELLLSALIVEQAKTNFMLSLSIDDKKLDKSQKKNLKILLELQKKVNEASTKYNKDIKDMAKDPISFLFNSVQDLKE